MFLQSKKKSSPNDVLESANPLMEHYLKRKREAMEESNVDKYIKSERNLDHSDKSNKKNKKFKTAAYINSEHELTSLLFSPTTGLLENLNASLTSDEIKNESVRKCCWTSNKRNLTNISVSPEDNEVYKVPENSMQFKALVQYMKKMGISSLTGAQYEAAMRILYERQHPAPAWIQAVRERAQQKESKHDLFNSTTSILSNNSITNGTALRYTEHRRVNLSVLGGRIQNLDMHPHSNLMSTFTGKRIHLSQFGNGSISTVETIDDASEATAAYFHRSGSSMILMKDLSKKTYTQTFDLIDLETGKRTSLQVAEGRQKTGSIHFEKTANYSVYGHSSSFTHANSSDFFAFGDSLSKGNIMLFDTKHPLPMETFVGGAPVTAISFSADCRYLFSAHQNAQVKVWDIRQRRPLVVHWDEGATDTTALSVNCSTTDIHYSTGSSNGVVNVYSMNQVVNECGNQIGKPKAKHTIQNLVAPISYIRYNNPHASVPSLLAIGSKEEVNSYRLVNTLNEYSVYSNFPSTSDLQTRYKISEMIFSPKGDYLFTVQRDNVHMYAFS